MSTATAQRRFEELAFSADFEVVKAIAVVEADPKDPTTAKGDWIVEGFAATTDLDLQNEEIEAGALESAAKDLLKNSTVLFNHSDDNPVGKVLESAPRDNGLWVKVRVSKSEPKLWEKVQDGTINKFSIRGRILDAFKKWSEKLKGYVRVIRKMTLVEVSLVSVPANPEARTLRWYVAKALDDLQKNGGWLPEVGGPSSSQGAESMSGQNATTTPNNAVVKAAETTPPVVVKPELILALDDKEKERVAKTASIVETLLGSEKDEGRKLALGVIKQNLADLTAGKAPSAFAVTGEFGKNLAVVVKANMIASIVAIAEGLAATEGDADRKKNLSAIVAEFKTPVPAAPAPESFEESLARNSDNVDDRIKRAVNAARNFLKSGSCGCEEAKKNEGVMSLGERVAKIRSDVTGIVKDLQIAIVPLVPSADAAKMDMVAPDADGKCPPGYQLKEGMCHKAGASPGGGMPDPGKPVAAYSAPAAKAADPVAAPVLTPEAQAEVFGKALEKALAPVAERLAKIERTAGTRKGLDGQEGVGSGNNAAPKGGNLTDMFRSVTGGALARAGVKLPEAKKKS